MTVDLKTIYNSPQLTSAEKRAVANSNLQDGAPDEPLNGIEVAAQLGVCLVSLGIVCAASCMDSPAVDIYEEHTDGGTTHTIGRNRNNRKANDGDNVSRSQDTQSNISDAGVHKAPGGRLHPRDAGFTSDAHPDAGGFACSPDHETLQVQTNSITERDYRDSDQPSSVWTGSEYAVSWTDFRTRGRNIFFARINPDGTKIGDDIQVTTTYAEGGDSFDASLAWSGSEYGLSWVDGRPNRPQRPEIYFARFDRNGEKLGTDTRITDAPTYKESPFLLWNGNEYGLAWHDNRDEQVIPFARISRDGVKLASEIHASNVGGYPNVPMLAWNGMEYGLSWFNTQVSPPSIFFTRVSGAGNKIGEDVVIQSDNGIAKPAPITWLGGQYAMTWGRNIETGFPDTTFYLRKISSEGQQIGRDLPIAEGSSPKMVWTGAEYGVVWHHDWNRNMELYFGRFDPNGNEIGETIRITNDRNSSYGADLVWNEQQREYAFSWVEGIYESGLEVDEIKFTRVQIIQPCP